MGKFAKIFRRLPDPRADNARHELLEVLFIALAAVLWAERSRVLIWRTSANRRKGYCGLSLVWSMGFRATTRSAGSSVCLNRKPSSGHSANSWRRLPRPTSSSCPEWWLSTARLCVEPTNAAARPPRCIWSMSLRWMPVWRWPSGRHPDATRRKGLWRCLSFSISKAASSRPMRCTAGVGLQRRCWNEAVTTP